jgi:hypothetical protein
MRTAASPDPQEMLAGVQFAEDHEAMPNFIEYHPQTGFLTVGAARPALEGMRTYLGFGAPFARGGGYDTADVASPITDYGELPAEFRNIDSQGKGVGPRMYNTWQGVIDRKVPGREVGAYLFIVDSSLLLDGRQTQGSTFERIKRHAGRMLRSSQTSPEDVVAAIHESYGAVDAVELEVPPMPILRLRSRGITQPDGITPSFMIVRNPAIKLHKIGTVPEAV